MSATLFAAVHIDIFAFLQIFILGLLLGHLYEKTKTLAASIVVHIMHNLLTLIFLLCLKYFFRREGAGILTLLFAKRAFCCRGFQM